MFKLVVVILHGKAMDEAKGNESVIKWKPILSLESIDNSEIKLNYFSKLSCLYFVV